MSPPAGTPAVQDGQWLRGDEAALYDRHHRALVRAVARTVRASPALIEDACQTAWAILLRRQPARATVFAWLRVVAIREAYRLSDLERRDVRLDDLTPVAEAGDWTEIIPDRRGLEQTFEARRALRALAGLPNRERRYLTLLAAGHG
jgi:DNA-directed RNA polymerase specialized sigma24 family protein